MAGVTAIQGVDETLKTITTAAVASFVPKPGVHVGPLDRESDELRLNWFLYRIAPNAAYRNMEPPATGWRSARGRPPLALQLQYLLTSFPASATDGGDQEQFAHAALAATMQALHANAIVGEGDAVLSALAAPLVEPLRITLGALDLEALSKLWTATTHPLRLSVGYDVSLVVVESLQTHAAGPPVRTRRIAVVPSMGPRLRSVEPSRASFGDELEVAVEGLAAGAQFTLARTPGDPPGPPAGWPLTAVTKPAPPPGTVHLTLPRADLEPGPRRLDVVVTQNGLLAGRDAIGLTLVPAVTGPAGPLAKGTPVTLDTAHSAGDVEVFLDGVPLAGVSFVSATAVQVTLPPATPAGAAEVALRAGKVAGPVRQIQVGP